MKAYQFILELKNKVSAPAKQMQKSIGGIVAKVNTVNAKLSENVNKVKGSLGTLPTAIGAAFATAGVVSFGKEVINTLAKFEKMEAVLTNTLGSSSAAQAALGQIKDFAASTPFQVDELTESFVKLANQNFKPTMSQMTALGDLASSTGKSFDQLAEAFLDAKTGEFERLKEFGVKAKKQGDLITFSFKGQTTTIKNSDKAVQDYLLSLGKAQGVQGAMAAISETTGGKLSNLSDKFTNLKLTIGEKLQPIIHQGINALSMMIDKLQSLVGWVAANKDTILTFGAAALKITAIVYGLTKVVKLSIWTFNAAKTAIAVATGIYKGFVAILTIVRNAQILFNIAMLANPIGLVIAAVVALGAALYVLVQHWDSIKAAVLRVTQPLMNLIGYIFPQFKVGLTLLSDWFRIAFEKISWIIQPVIDSVKWVIDNVKKIAGYSVDSPPRNQRETNQGSQQKSNLPDKEMPEWNMSQMSNNLNTNLGAGGKTDRQSATANIVGSRRNVSNYNIEIGKLVEQLTIQTTHLKEGTKKAKELVSQALMQAVNDLNYGT